MKQFGKIEPSFTGEGNRLIISSDELEPVHNNYTLLQRILIPEPQKSVSVTTENLILGIHRRIRPVPSLLVN